MTWFYLSFADGERPKGEQFLGALILEASDAKDAMARSHRIGENPGGEIMGKAMGKPGARDLSGRFVSLRDRRSVT